MVYKKFLHNGYLPGIRLDSSCLYNLYIIFSENYNSREAINGCRAETNFAVWVKMQRCSFSTQNATVKFITQIGSLFEK